VPVVQTLPLANLVSMWIMTRQDVSTRQHS
jgi:hypothetical protein